MKRVPHQRRSRICTRRGLAPVEFVMGLPLLVILLLAMLTVCSFGVTQTSVEIRARQDVWSERFARRSARRMPIAELKHLTQVLGPNIAPPPDGGLRQDVEVDTAVSIVPDLFARVAERRAQHELLADAWDYQTIDFEQNRNEHPPLFATFRMEFFRLDVPFQRDALAALGELGGAAGNAARLSRGENRADRGEARLAAEIARVMDEIERVRGALDRALSDPMPDDAEIDRLRNELDTLESQLDQLLRARDVIDSEDPRPTLTDDES